MMTAKLASGHLREAARAIEVGGLERTAYARCYVGEENEEECLYIGGDGEGTVPDVEDALSGKLGKVAYSVEGVLAAAVHYDYSTNPFTYDVLRVERILAVFGGEGQTLSPKEMQRLNLYGDAESISMRLREMAEKGQEILIVFQDLDDVYRSDNAGVWESEKAQAFKWLQEYYRVTAEADVGDEGGDGRSVRDYLEKAFEYPASLAHEFDIFQEDYQLELKRCTLWKLSLDWFIETSRNILEQQPE